jgi:outer membrane protein assembly factor BamA
VLADYRRYVLLRPLTFAVRAVHVGRYGPDAESERLTPLFIGYDSLVRGYTSGSFELSECSTGDARNCPQFNRLIGSRIGVANFEVRFPFFGTDRWGLINFPYLPTELAGFVDAGVAWTEDEKPDLKFRERSADRIPVFSTGATARFNILGALIMEVYYAYPFQRPDKGAHFGFQIQPGW